MSNTAQPTTPYDSWLTVSAAAKAAGVTRRTIARLAAKGELTALFTPYGRLIEPTQIPAYVTLHKQRYRMDEYRKSTKPSAESTDAAQEGRRDE